MVKSEQVEFSESSIIHCFGNAVHYGKKKTYMRQVAI